ncbi:MAG: hypothetical protein P4N60_11310 [Verrucomicrobiae bacterium]|nr:hypothetical protein [Verrucomicrobiae bacterium]
MKNISSSRILPLAASALLWLAITGCGRDTVKVYHVDTNETTTVAVPPAPVAPAAATPSGVMPSTMPAGLAAPDNSGLPALKYTLPAGWQEKALTQMRVASFSVADNGKQADVSVIPMGGMAGGNLANVNRWRGQVGQQPTDEDTIQKMTEKIVIAGQDADLFDIAGTSPGSGDAERIIASVLHKDDTAWFFKITGDADLVEKQKPAFIAFLKSIDFGAPAAAAAPMDMSQLPPSHPPIGGMSPAMAAAPAGDKPVWEVPAGWQEGPLAQFLVAKYLIAGAGGAKAEVNVSSLAGDGGGLAPNVNRWRAQLGLAPATADDLAKFATIDASGVKATVVEFSGTNPRTSKPATLIGVILPLGGQTWFYKLMGDAEVVAQQKDALMKFVQSAKYPDAH